MFSGRIVWENSTKRFFAQPWVHMGTQKMLRGFKRQTLEANFLVMRVVVNHREGQKQLKKVALNLKNSLDRPPVYNGSWPEML